MNNTGVKTLDGKGSLVIENHDLIADIEQDRFITDSLEKSTFVFKRFPHSLEAAYKVQNQKMHAGRFGQAMVSCALLLGATAIFDLISGGAPGALLVMVPSMILLALGLGLQNSSIMAVFQQVFVVLLAAVAGYGVQGMPVPTGAAHHWLVMYALALLVVSVRVPLYLPTIVGVAIAGGITAIQPDQVLQTSFVFALVASFGFMCWLWREDADRRQFLQFCLPQAPNRSVAGVKETQRARQLVVLDKQTGLANNTSFMRFFTNEWRRAFRARQSLSLILIHFDVTIEKLTEHGHLDRVLTELQRYSRRPGDMVGKMDEKSFAVLLSNTDIANSRRLAQSLLEHLHGLDLGKEGSLKVYMGVASTLPMPSMSHEDLYAKASEALNSAKDNPSS